MESFGNHVNFIVMGFPYRLGFWRTGKDGASAVHQGDVRRAELGFRNSRASPPEWRAMN